MKQIFSLLMAMCLLFCGVLPVMAMGNTASAAVVESGNNLWSDTGNYNADWTGLTDYANTTEFIITDAADLAAFMIALNQNKSHTFEGKTVTLENDIDLSDHLWDMRGGIPRTGGNGNFFAGTFDGGGHTLSGMTIDYDNEYVGMGNDFGNFGLFADLNGATIRDLTISDAQLTIGYVAPSFPAGIGVLCGSISGSTIENVTVTNASIAQKENAQGSIGFYFGSIAGIEFSPYTRTPSNEPNQYIGCNVDGLSITYSEAVDDNWTALMGFGGMIGGVFPLDAEPSYQSSITDCMINDVTLRRSLAAESFAFECYGGVIGFAPYPVTIENTHVTDLSIEFGAPSSNTDSNMMGTPFATGIVGGFIGYAERDADSFPNGTSSITNSSVSGSIAADNQADLLPVYVGGLIGVNNGVTATDCYTQLDFTDVKNKGGVRYGNLFGLLETSTEQGVEIIDNIFDNHDYLATAAEIDAPSVGYLGEKLSTLALADELDNTADIDLSQNWSILKNILTSGEKAHPLDYVQCAEKTADVDFYDHWTVDSYEHEYLTQDGDTAQVTFDKDSGKDTFLVSAEITAQNGNPTWHFIKDIIVLPDPTPPAPTYIVTYLPGEQGSFEPQKYSGLHTGDVTPVFHGIPTGNQNWSFNGWEPEVAATVTENAVYTAQWKDAPPTTSESGDICLTKLDADTKSPLPGAAFGIYNPDGTKMGEITSGTDGTAVSLQLPKGSYYLTELRAPQGYALSQDKHTVTVVSGETTELTVFNKALPTSPPVEETKPGTLRIIKLDRDSGKKLVGAVFGVYNADSDKQIDTLTTDKNGVAELSLPAGDYYIREQEAPKGYILKKTDINFHLESGATRELTVKNTPEDEPEKLGILELTKEDGDSGKALRNAVFAAYTKDNEKIDEVTTGWDGIAELELPVGSYYLREVEAPRGYKLDRSKVTFKISENKTTRVTVENDKEKSEPVKPETPKPEQPKPTTPSQPQPSKPAPSKPGTTGASGRIELVKLAAGSGSALPGAVFGVYDEKGGKLSELTTGVDGMAALSLPVGRYYLKEQRAPYGYKPETARIRVDLLQNKTTIVEVTNEIDPDAPPLPEIHVPQTGIPFPAQSYALATLLFGIAAFCGVMLSRSKKCTQ